MSEYERRLDRFESRLRELETELAKLRTVAPVGETATKTPARPDPMREQPAPWPSARPRVSPAPHLTQPPRVTPPPRATTTPPRVTRPPRDRPPFDLSTFLGGRALAATGGVVSLLGIVFFFALAVERGWIGPVARVSLGAIASGLALGAGWWLRSRFGETYSSVAAAGAGIAGAYATLLAAAARYDLVSDPLALVLAALIAAGATVTALSWSDQGLAGLGLVGAILAPVAVAVRDEHLAATGVGFAALMLAASIAVALARNWHKLLVVAAVAAGSQMVALLLDASGRTGRVLALAIVLWLLYLGTGVFEALRGKLTQLSGSFVIAGCVLSGYAAASLFDGSDLGVALLVPALVNGIAAAALFGRARDLASLLWATALALAALGTAQLLSGATLSMAWAAETAVLAWLAQRLREPRFRLAALAWITLALVHALDVDAPLSKLFTPTDHPASGVPTLLALLVAAALTGWFSTDFDEEPGHGVAAELVNTMRAVRRELRLAAFALAGLLGLEAASLGLLALLSSWDWGHVAVTSLWGLTAVALVLAGRRAPGTAWGGATIALAVLYDAEYLDGSARWCALAAAGATSLVVGLLFERELRPVATTGLVAGAGLLAAAALGIAGGDLRWLLLLGVGAGYAGLGALFLHARRDQSTLLWATGLAFALAASERLLDHFWLVLAWATAAAALAVLARFEQRLDPAALVFLGLALLATLVTEAPPEDLFVSQRHPGGGVPAVLIVLAAGAVYAWRRRTPARAVVIQACATLAVYAASLSILELAEALGNSVDTSFQRGESAVSALWGLIGLALLYVGLVRRLRPLQLGGLALFALSLAKLFLYDLAFLSSITRALSFLAVGAVLIAGGFFSQRLSARPE